MEESSSSDNNNVNSSGVASSQYSGLPRLDLSKPRYDQSTYMGRAKHFFETANPLNAFVSSKRLEEAATLVKSYKSGCAPAGTTEEQLWEAKRLYDSAYHPDTGEKMFLPGRMSFQVPGNMVITGCVLTFYRHPLHVVFWQWANQSFNSLVNYTNRSGKEIITPKQILVPYLAATGTATVTALGLNQVVAKRLPPLMGRMIPFVAIAAANCINIPLVRQRELKNGVPVYDAQGNCYGQSQAAATKGIEQVVFSRILMAMPAMVIPPFVMNYLDKNLLKKFPRLNAPIQILLVGFCLTFTTPLCCALFPQQSSISVSRLEAALQNGIPPQVKTVYFNKGL